MNDAKRDVPGDLGRTPVRNAAALGRRRAGLDYDGIPTSLAETAIEPGDPGYRRVKSTYIRGGAPGIVLRPRTEKEVVDALAFAREHPGLPFAVRSGGHGISGRSTNDGGIVLDLGALNSMEVIDPSRRLVRIGPGARWHQVAAFLRPYGWALTSGDYGGVGVGGSATAGGLGWMARKYGLTIDHLRVADLILADGSQVRASDTENPDLFWAVRGAGSNVGVVTSFEFEVDEVTEVGWAQFVVDAGAPEELLVGWGAAVEAASRDLTSELLMGPPRRGRPGVAQVMAMVDSDDPETIVDQLNPLAALAPLHDQSVVLTPYAEVMGQVSGEDHDGRGEPVARSGLIEHITAEFAAAAVELLRSGAVFFFQIRSAGGAVADIPPDATAYAGRSSNFQVVAIGSDRSRLDDLWDRMHHHFNGNYFVFDTDRRTERLTDAFGPDGLRRLRELKSRYDPGNLFNDNLNVFEGLDLVDGLADHHTGGTS